MGTFFQRLKQGLNKTQRRLTDGLRRAIGTSPVLSDELFDDIEAALIGADCGVALSEQLVAALRDDAAREGISDYAGVTKQLKSQMVECLNNTIKVGGAPAPAPRVTLFVGVNGAGKTTSIGKIGSHHAREGRSILFAAADTFRAAATEQLQIWSERVGAQLVSAKPGADPAAVAFDAVTAARARGIDEVLIDTAGRLHTKSNLMAELSKLKRSAGKARGENGSDSVRVLLVLDATTGQNGLSQAKHFQTAVGVDGIVLTKLDGTAKGGIVLAIASELRLPVVWVGVGETADDLDLFESDQFIAALFD